MLLFSKAIVYVLVDFLKISLKEMCNAKIDLLQFYFGEISDAKLVYCFDSTLRTVNRV